MRLKLNTVLVIVLMLAAGRSMAQHESASIDELYGKLEAAVIDTQRANVLNSLSFAVRSRDTLKAFQYAEEALNISRKESYPYGEAVAYHSFADHYRDRGRADRSLEFYHRALDIFLEIGSKPEAARIYNNIGVVYERHADYNAALDYLKRALDLNLQSGDRAGIARNYNNMGNSFYLQGDFSNALESYFASLKIREQLGDKQGMAKNYNNIGNIYNDRHNYDKAFEYYNKALKLKEDLGDKKNLCTAYNNMGSFYYRVKNYKKAMEFFDKALATSREVGNKATLADAYTYVGHLRLDEEQYMAAIDNYSKALTISQELGDKKRSVHAYNALGKLFTQMRSYDSAITNLQKALQLATEIGAREEVKAANGALAEAYEKSGDLVEAIKSYKSFIASKDSIFNAESAKLLAEMDIKYQSGKKQKEIDLLKKEKEIQEIKLSGKNMVMYLSLGCAVLMLVLVGVILRINRQKQKVNTMLIEQNRKISRQKEEKEILLKEVHHRVKNNLQVISSLLNLQSVHISDPDVASLFTDCQNRVRSMALIHEKLYTAADLSKVEILNYIESLAHNLLRTYRLKKNIALDLDLSVTNFGISTLIPVGLLLNELISNSLKHAFSDLQGTGTITVKISPLGDHRYEMIAGDNGRGMPSELLYVNGNSLGLELVHTFVEQLDGTIERMEAPGTVFKIIFVDIDAIQQKRKASRELAAV